jgi:D-alanyl-D-alanine dipeptidase
MIRTALALAALSYGLLDAGQLVPGLHVELKYATADNFLHKNVYGSLNRCYLHKAAAHKLARAQQLLTRDKPGYHLHVYDCARPRSVQLQMWEVVKNTPQAPYVANPHTPTGSIHNYGGAVDLTIDDAKGQPLDMGTPFDYFGDLANIDHEATLVARGRLTKPQLANRLLLRKVMTQAGFQPLKEEWWHFNSDSPEVTRTRYRIIS